MKTRAVKFKLKSENNFMLLHNKKERENEANTIPEHMGAGNIAQRILHAILQDHSTDLDKKMVEIFIQHTHLTKNESVLILQDTDARKVILTIQIHNKIKIIDERHPDERPREIGILDYETAIRDIKTIIDVLPNMQLSNT